MNDNNKNERNEEHWNDLTNIVKQRRQSTNESNTTDSQGSDMSHDDAIFDFISSEIDRTSAPATNLEAPSNQAQSAWYQRALVSISSIFNEGLFPNSLGSGARGVAMAALCAVVILPIAYKVSNNTNDGTNPIAVSNAGFEIPVVVFEIASDSTEHINYAGSNIGISSSEQSEIVKAFMTGVVHSDISIINNSNDVSNIEQLKRSLFEYHAINILQEANDLANAEAAYKQSLSLYKNNDEHSKWLYKGMAIELIYLTANVGLDTKAYAPLAAMLNEYKIITQGKAYEDQSVKYYEEHNHLLSYANNAASGELSDADIKNIRKHARNMKVRIQ